MAAARIIRPIWPCWGLVACPHCGSREHHHHGTRGALADAVALRGCARCSYGWREPPIGFVVGDGTGGQAVVSADDFDAVPDREG